MEVTTVEETLEVLEGFGFIKSGEGENRIYELPRSFGSGSLRVSGPLDRYYLVSCNAWFRENFAYGFHISERFIELSAVSDSQLCYELPGDETTRVLKGIRTHINLGEPGVISIPASTRLTYTSFVIREDTISRNLGFTGPDTDLTRPGNAALINRIPSCHRQARILSDLSQCRMPAHVKHLYYENKALEVLCLLSEALHCRRAKTPAVSPGDRNTVNEARQILARQMSCPPTITELSREVGMSATKLKQVFKQETGRTIYGYLRGIRLGAAVSLMEDPGATIVSVSRDVGYNSPGKFSTAFKEQYGLNPGKYLRMVRQRARNCR